MAMAHPPKSSRRDGTCARRHLPRAAALATVALLSLLLGSAAGAAPAAAGEDSSAFGVLGRTVLAAIGSSGANHAVDTLGNSLALLGARYEVEQGARPAGQAASEPGQEAGSPPPSEEEVDPSKLPP